VKGVVKNRSGMLWKEDLDLFMENMGKFVHRHKHLEVRIFLSSAQTHTHTHTLSAHSVLHAGWHHCLCE